MQAQIFVMLVFTKTIPTLTGPATVLCQVLALLPRYLLALGERLVERIPEASPAQPCYYESLKKDTKMQSTLTSLTNPRWSDAKQTTIDCEITTSQFGDEVLPFTASATDCEAHGRAIFADIVAGAYGEIAEYVPPPPEAAPTPATGTIPTEVL